MRTLVLSIAACLLFQSVVAQYHPQAPQASVNPDSLLTAGMDEVLSYLLLTREDFRFRGDYMDKDSFRLKIVDSLMRRPLLMGDFVRECADRCDSIHQAPDRVLQFIASVAGTQYETAILSGSAISRPESWRDALSSLDRNLQLMADASDRYLSEGMSPEEVAAVVSGYKDLLLEDVADKEKSAEELDSLTRAEEQFAMNFAKTAAALRFPTLFAIQPIIDQLAMIASGLEKDRKAFERGQNKQIYLSGKKEKRKIVIGGYGHDEYCGEYDMIIDPGGDDSYYLEYEPGKPHPTIIADFGGNDIYEAKTPFALATGAFSYSILIDYDGDDVYRGGSFSLGTGYFGVGILWDKKGNDSYIGDTFTQGAGTFGFGLLIDSDGSDTYTGNLNCQGFGFVSGMGGIIDASGNDVYTVQPKYGDFIRYEDHYVSMSQGFGNGVRPFLSGGAGFLFDYAGNDTYVSDIFGQGASYWYSLGMLYDRLGNDQYLSHQYAQGNGTHMSLGILRDDTGNDIYRAYGVSQGCGHDYACGWLLDRQGNDLYASYDLSQGAGQANGFGIFTDLTGDDRYYVMLKNNTQGYGNPRRDYGSIGVFLDLDGDDRYDGNGTNNRFWTTNSKWGGGLDRSIPVSDSAEAKP